MNRAVLLQVMLAAAQCRALGDVLSAIVKGLAAGDDVVLARIWLMGPGDVCASCAFAPECAERTRCLHLAASAGNAVDEGEDLTRLDGAFRRFPMGVRKIGKAGLSGEPMVLRDLERDAAWVARPDWVRRARLQTVVAMPLVFRAEVVGVLGVFDRSALSQDDLDWLRVLADHAAVSIANARAFEEIERLRARAEEETLYLRNEVQAVLGAGDVVGSSPAMARVMEQVRLVAPTDSAVLVTGETGTGKEVVARAVHEHGPRRARAFIKVNCGAIPEALFESEFFGHVKGAFTGAMRDKPGRFELADGGTLLLDEIGELPPSMQAKLLRVLQEKEIERVGDARPRAIDVRIVAATNRSLRDEVAAGRFRQDLFYRLSVFPIELPPLRERREDVAPLLTWFATQIARRMNVPPPRVSAATVRRLEAYDWPGNVRELQHAVERAIIVSRGGPLRFDLAGDATPRPPVRAAEAAPETKVLTRDEVRERERENVARALAKANGKVFGPGGAAELLGMKPTTLASRIRALGLTRR